jgi:hypothetical protein
MIFRKVWRDLMDLSRGEFAVKYILPFIAAFMTYATIGSFCMAGLSTSSLEKQTGKVVDMQVAALQGARNTYNPLWIRLDNYKDDFRLMESYSSSFKQLQSEIKAGDEITIFHRNTFLTILGFGKTYDVFQVDKGDKELFSIKTVRNHYFKIGLLTAFFSFGLWTTYYLLHVRRRRRITPDTKIG